jgi:lysophospholipase L1-like esterase
MNRSWKTLAAEILLAQMLTTATTAAGGPVAEAKPDKWWQESHGRHVARAREGSIDVLFLGDSITQGWRELGSEAWAYHFAPLGAVAFGINADRAENVLWRITHGELDGISPRVVVLMIGTNNLKGGEVRQPPGVIRDGVAALLAVLRERLPGARVILCGILPRQPDKYDWITLALAETNRLLAALADGDRVCFLDMTAGFAGPDGSLARGLYTRDALHLSSAGYFRWAHYLLPVLRPMLGWREPQPNRVRIEPEPPGRQPVGCERLVPGSLPEKWVVAGPWPSPASNAPPEIEVGMPLTVGESVCFSASNAVARVVTANDRYSYPTYTGQHAALDVTAMHGRRTRTVSVLSTTLSNAAPRSVQFRFLTPGGSAWNPPTRVSLRAWLGNQELNEHDNYELAAGAYVLRVTVLLRACDAWGRIWIAPRFVAGEPDGARSPLN